MKHHTPRIRDVFIRDAPAFDPQWRQKSGISYRPGNHYAPDIALGLLLFGITSAVVSPKSIYYRAGDRCYYNACGIQRNGNSAPSNNPKSA